MTSRYRISVWMLSALALLTGSLTLAPLFRHARAQQPQEQLSPQAQRQIEALLAEKKNRTPEQRKIESQLLYEMKQQRGEALAREVPRLETNVKPDPEGRVLIDIRAHQVSDELRQLIARLDGTVQFSSVEDKTIRAEFPLKALEELARSADVRFIEPAVESRNNSRPFDAGRQFARQAERSGPAARLAARDPQFVARAVRVKAQLSGALPSLRAARRVAPASQAAGTGLFVSQGDRGHRADAIRSIFGADGSGIRIGVLSDSVRYLAESQASGDLPPDVTVIPGESGITPTSPLSGEGTAMMEIIYDLAPGAKLFFATAAFGDARFAANIRRLRSEFKCDIIVDDVFYFNESPFQDAIIARAVNDVTADGALYFSAAGNEGNGLRLESLIQETEFCRLAVTELLRGRRFSARPAAFFLRFIGALPHSASALPRKLMAQSRQNQNHVSASAAPEFTSKNALFHSFQMKSAAHSGTAQQAAA